MPLTKPSLPILDLTGSYSEQVILSRRFHGLTSLPLTEGIAGDWEEIRLATQIRCDAAGDGVFLQLSVDGGATYLTTGYDDNQVVQFGPTSFVTSWSNNKAGIPITGVTAVGKWVDAEIILRQPNAGTIEKHARVDIQQNNGSPLRYSAWVELPTGPGAFGASINALKIVATNGGNIEGVVTVTGRKNVDQYPVTNPIKKIAVLGSSLVAIGGWTDPVQDQLQTAQPSKQTIVRNFGYNGMNSDGAKLNVPNVLSCKPEVALIGSFENDAVTTFGMSTSQSAANHNAIIDALRVGNPGIQIFLVTYNPMIGGGASARPSLSTYYGLAAGIASAKNVGLIDTYPLWGTMTSGQFQNADGIHPTPATNLAILVPAVVAALL